LTFIANQRVPGQNRRTASSSGRRQCHLRRDSGTLATPANRYTTPQKFSGLEGPRAKNAALPNLTVQGYFVFLLVVSLWRRREGFCGFFFVIPALTAADVFAVSILYRAAVTARL